MAAQRQEDFPPERARAIGRRIGMVMAAGEIETNAEMGRIAERSESTIGRWRRGDKINWSVAPLISRAAGRGSLHPDKLEVENFLALRTDAFPWNPDLTFREPLITDLSVLPAVA